LRKCWISKIEKIDGEVVSKLSTSTVKIEEKKGKMEDVWQTQITISVIARKRSDRGNLLREFKRQNLSVEKI